MNPLTRLWRSLSSPFRGGRTRPLSPPEKSEVTRELTEPVVGDEGVRPGAAFWNQENDTPDLGRMYRDVPAMMAHPRVALAMRYQRSGIAGATFEVEDASSPEAGAFAKSEAERFWRRCRRQAQMADEYGRGAGELVYAVEDGLLRLAELFPHAGIDAVPLVLDGRLRAVRLRSATLRGGAGGGHGADLPSAAGALPAKGWWHAHDRGYSRWYGTPQHYGAWRPWRRLAGKDGAEDTIDGGVYRFAFRPPVGRYPAHDNQPQTPGVAPSSNRDKMRQMVEWIRSGAAVALSSVKYGGDQGGGYLWDLEWPEGSLDVSGLIAYSDSLEKGISLGCGVPPELLEASETGSGYSGRWIPMEAFYLMEQGHAEDLTASWYTQVCAPLLRWNYGPQAWARLRVCDLLKQRMKAAKEAQAGGEGGPGQGQGAGGMPGGVPR